MRDILQMILDRHVDSTSCICSIALKMSTGYCRKEEYFKTLQQNVEDSAV